MYENNNNNNNNNNNSSNNNTADTIYIIRTIHLQRNTYIKLTDK